MWKNWNPFRRKEEKKTNTGTGSAATENKNVNAKPLSTSTNLRCEKSATTTNDIPTIRSPLIASPDMWGNGNASRSSVRMYDSGAVSQNRTSQSQSSQSVVNVSGPLLSTPLLPKIKRAIEMNESYSGRSMSPLTRNRVSRSASMNYGPTHPTRSTPGRLPVVQLQRRPSLHYNSRSVQSPTVKVAPPDATFLSGPSFRMSPARPSPVPAVVDTQMVLSALRERRKRTNVQEEENFIEGDLIQIAKRRRQDSTHSNISLPSMPDVYPDPSQDQDILSSFTHIEPGSLKRRSAMTHESFSMNAAETSTPKRGCKDFRSSILSSLSSSKRAEEKKAEMEEPQLGKRNRSTSISESETGQLAKRVNPTLRAHSEQSARTPATVATGAQDRTKLKETVATKSAEPGPGLGISTPKETSLLNLSSQTRQRSSVNVYPPLRSSATKMVTLASPADLELDRKEEEARRVKDILAYLDEDDEPQSDLSKPAPVADILSKTAPALTTLAPLHSAAALTTISTAIITPTTTASSLTQLLASTTSTSSTASTAATIPSLLSSTASTAPIPSLFSAYLSMAGKSVAPSPSGTSLSPSGTSGFMTSTSGLVHSSGASVSGLSPKPICSTGSAATAGLFDLSQTSSVSLHVGDTVTAGTATSTQAPSLVSTPQTGATTTAPSSSGPSAQYSFKPVFPEQAASNSTPTTGGFTFRASTPSTTQAASPMSASLSGEFSFGAGGVLTSTHTPAMSTGLSGSNNGSSASVSQPFTFGTITSGASANSEGLGFGGTSAGKTSTDASSGFSFGGSQAVAGQSSSMGFSMGGTVPQSFCDASLGLGTGQPASSIDAGKGLQPKSLFGALQGGGAGGLSGTNSPSYGASIGQSMAPSFGQTTSTVGAPSGGVGFGATTAAPSTFTFGQTIPATSAGGVSTGTPTSANSGGMFTFGTHTAPATTTANKTSFGQTSASSAETFAFNAPAKSSMGSGFSFTSPSASTASGMLGFGGTTTSAPMSTGTFAFGATSPPKTTAAHQSSSAFVFGSNSSGGSGGLAFGARQQSQQAPAFGATQSQSQAPAFGSSQMQGAPAFGATQMQAAPAFGATQTQAAPAFGATQTQAAPAFGATQTQAAPVFGATQTQAAPAFGTTQTQAAPAFGATQTQAAPAFGSQSSFSFGSSSSASTGFNFGGTSSTVPAFGVGSTSSTQPPPPYDNAGKATAFGGTHSQSSTPVFGASANPASSTTASSFTFGGSSSQSSTPFTFGAPQTQTTGGGAGFPFGQSTGAGASAGFNFSTSGASFNFAAAAPAQGQNMFSTGLGSTAAKPRAAATKARRRGTRK